MKMIITLPTKRIFFVVCFYVYYIICFSQIRLSDIDMATMMSYDECNINYDGQPQKIHTAYQDYCIIVNLDGKYGAYDILGNEISLKYKSKEKLLQSKTWEKLQTAISRNELAYKEQESKLNRLCDSLYFQEILNSMKIAQKSQCSSDEVFNWTGASLRRIVIGGKVGIVDSDYDWLIDTLFNDIKINFHGRYSLYNDRPANHWLIAEKGEEVCHLSYSGEIKCIIKKTEREYLGSLCRNSGDGENCYLYKNLSDNKEYYALPIDYDTPLKSFLSNLVELNMGKWYDKKEFETLQEYQTRLSPKITDMAMNYFANKAILLYVQLGLLKNTTFQLRAYDKDNESFLMKSEIGDIPIRVPANQSLEFRSEFSKSPFFPDKSHFSVDNNNIYLVGVEKNWNGTKYYGKETYSYNSYNINDNKEKIVVKIKHDEIKEQKEEQISVAKSEVDINIPYCEEENNSHFYAFIVGNEQYWSVANVSYAENDAKVFGEYCRKTLGMPDQNVKVYPNATYGTMIGIVNDMQSIAKAYNGDINVIFYYAGHGIPDETTRDAFLLPVDANGQQTEACYELSRLYRELGELGAKNVVVFLDACFSGAQRGGKDMLASIRGVGIKPKKSVPQGNMVVFSATTDDETAFPYEEKGHGMFTYFLLKKLRDTKGDCTLGELGEYIQTNVCQQSNVIIRKSQTPSILSSGSMEDSWKNLKLR